MTKVQGFYCWIQTRLRKKLLLEMFKWFFFYQITSYNNWEIKLLMYNLFIFMNKNLQQIFKNQKYTYTL